MITLGLLNEKEITLDLMTERCYEIQEGLVVTSQAIKNRIDTCTEFLKESTKETFGLLFEALESDVVDPLKVLFADVKIVDSSIIALPDGLKEDYKGLGGRNADSAVKLQVIYSAFNRSMLACDLKHGTENDKVYLEEVDTYIKKSELFLADLGYFKTEFLQHLDATNRFFISRLKTNTLFYILTDQGVYEQVSFNKYVEATTDTFDQYLYVGIKKFYARVTGIKVPEDVYKERLRKAIKNDPTISAEKKCLLHWNRLHYSIAYAGK